jgi:hypothetical protein
MDMQVKGVYSGLEDDGKNLDIKLKKHGIDFNKNSGGDVS